MNQGSQIVMTHIRISHDSGHSYHASAYVDLNIKSEYMKDSAYSMQTLSEVMNVLRTRGYNINFNAEPERKFLEKSSSQDFKIDRIYRFEGITDPDDEAILYAISSRNSEIKGYLVNGYGVYSDEAVNLITEKLSKF